MVEMYSDLNLFLVDTKRHWLPAPWLHVRIETRLSVGQSLEGVQFPSKGPEASILNVL